MKITLTINQQLQEFDVPENTLLVNLIRESAGLTGTHVGCDTSQCGACTILVNNHAVKSCSVLAAQMNGASITTIEGVASNDGTLHPMQVAFKECHGLQCGFCTPGMVMSAIDICQQHPNASADDIRHLLEGNICRCTGYHNIIKAVQMGAKNMSNQ